MTQYPLPQPSQGRLPPFSSFSFDSTFAFPSFRTTSDSFPQHSSFPLRREEGTVSILPIPFSVLPRSPLSNCTYSVRKVSERSALSNLVNMSAISKSNPGNNADGAPLYPSERDPRSSFIPYEVEPPPQPAQPPPLRPVSTIPRDTVHHKNEKGNAILKKPIEKDASASLYRQRKLLRGRRTSPNSSLPCDVCNQLYSRKDNLRAHQRVHSGEKPYTCSECSVRFRWLGALRSHQASHRRRRISASQKSKIGNQRSYLRPMRLRQKETDAVSVAGGSLREGEIGSILTSTNESRDVHCLSVDERGSGLYDSVEGVPICENLSSGYVSGLSKRAEKDPAIISEEERGISVSFDTEPEYVVHVDQNS